MSRLPFAVTVALLGLAACATDPHAPTELVTPDHAAAAKSGASGGGSGTTVYSYALSGDVSSTGTPSTAHAGIKGPFSKISIANASVVLSAPTGNIDACIAGGTYTNFVPAFPPGDVGITWTGTIGFPGTGVLNFLGVNAAGDTLQFTVMDNTGGPQQTVATGVYTLAYTDAAYFSDTRSTNYDGQRRCVNITVTAAPAQ